MKILQPDSFMLFHFSFLTLLSSLLFQFAIPNRLSLNPSNEVHDTCEDKEQGTK